MREKVKSMLKDRYFFVIGCIFYTFVSNIQQK